MPKQGYMVATLPLDVVQLLKPILNVRIVAPWIRITLGQPQILEQP